MKENEQVVDMEEDAQGNEDSAQGTSDNAQPNEESMHEENKRKHEDEDIDEDEPAHKSRTLPWTAGNLPPDADLSMIGSIMKMGVSEQTAREFVTGKKMHKWNSDEQRAAKELEKYGRDCTNHVTEMYSPPRVTKMTQ